MSRPRRAPSSNSHRYPRTARLNESLREVIAEELTRIDDERLDLVTITAIDVDSEMNRAIVYYDSLRGEDGDAEILEALNAHRVRIQGSIGRQVRAKKTPILTFKPDEVIRSAEHIEKILSSTETLPERPEDPDELDDVSDDDDLDDEFDDEFDDDLDEDDDLDGPDDRD
ncbi:MAG: 30S ribosome-binding factor RbfA [Acidimicrobiales bacterium]